MSKLVSRPSNKDDNIYASEKSDVLDRRFPTVAVLYSTFVESLLRRL